MNLLSTLRRTRALAGIVQAWFVLALLLGHGASPAGATALPSFEMVCSGAAGMKLVVHDDGGALKAPVPDCPLCLQHAYLPPPPVLAMRPVQRPLGHALRPVPAARIAELAAAPLPARGPPQTA